MPIITGRTPSGNVVDVALDEDGKLRLSGTVAISGDVAATSKDILEKYKFSDTKTITATDYFGYLDKDGNWYILQLTTAAGRYASGGSAYAANYALADSLTYYYFNEVF